MDPLAEKYYGVSPYGYCNNSPIQFIDTDGNRPIYSPTGELLGTDDGGLQGDAFIMDPQNFHQGMSEEEASTFNIGLQGLQDEEALKRFNDSFNGLKDRPDWDGYLTLEEANDWYRNGSGQPLYVTLDKIDLRCLYSLGEHFVGQKKVVDLFAASCSINDALVYGKITLVRYPDHSVRAFSDDYGFEMKSWLNPFNIGRNVATLIGKNVAGKGADYRINIYGSKKLEPIVPWIK